VSPRAWVLFILSSIIWGVPYLFIKVAVDANVPPAFVAWSRIVLAAALLVPLAWHRGALRGLRGRAGAIVGYAACEGRRALRADRRRALLGVDVAGRPGELLGAAMVLLATLGYAIAPIIVSRYLTDLDPLGPVAASLTVAAIALLPAALATPPHRMPGPAALASIVVLGVICTALGLVVFFRLITEVGPSRASVITYVNPVVAVVIGVLALAERLGSMSIAGLLLILGGSWLSTDGRASSTH
jgi:drug/metabolite transporter (DMT)-like permease